MFLLDAGMLEGMTYQAWHVLLFNTYSTSLAFKYCACYDSCISPLKQNQCKQKFLNTFLKFFMCSFPFHLRWSNRDIPPEAMRKQGNIFIKQWFLDIGQKIAQDCEVSHCVSLLLSLGRVLSEPTGLLRERRFESTKAISARICRTVYKWGRSNTGTELWRWAETSHKSLVEYWSPYCMRGNYLRWGSGAGWEHITKRVGRTILRVQTGGYGSSCVSTIQVEIICNTKGIG